MPGALEGLRVVDLTTGLAGPLATMTLERPRRRRREGRAARRRSAARRTSGRSSRTAASAASCSTSTTPPIATGCSSSSTPPTCSSRASRPGTSRRAGSTTTPSPAELPALDVLLAHRLPAHHRRRRPPGHRPARAGALGHAVRAARLPRRPDLPARAAAEHRGVVPHGGGRPRRAVRPRDHRPRASGWRRRSTRACSRSPRSCGRTPSIRPEPWVEIGRDPRPSIYECADGLWVHSMHFAGGRGKDRSVVWGILGIDPPDLEWDPTGAARRSRTDRPRRDRAR